MGAFFDGAVYSMKRSQAPGNFYEVLHSEAIRRKRDSTYQDVAFFRRCFVTFSRKEKVKQKPYTHQEVTFFRRRFSAFDGKKGDALYEGKREHTILPS